MGMKKKKDFTNQYGHQKHPHPDILIWKPADLQERNRPWTALSKSRPRHSEVCPYREYEHGVADTIPFPDRSEARMLWLRSNCTCGAHHKHHSIPSLALILVLILLD